VKKCFKPLQLSLEEAICPYPLKKSESVGNKIKFLPVKPNCNSVSQNLQKISKEITKGPSAVSGDF